MFNIRSRLRSKLRDAGLLAIACLLLAGQLTILPASLWADSGAWVDGSFPILAVGQQVPNASDPVDCFPATFTYWSYTKPNGSYDSVGRSVDVATCATENQLGFYGGSGSHDDYELIRPNTANAFQVFDARQNASAVTPVPNQADFFTKDSSQSFHGEVAPHFYDNFPSAGTFGPANNQLAFTINKPGTVLADHAGTKLYMHSYAFSNNGEWMVMEARGLGIARVNTATRQMQLFDPMQLSYGQGFTPVATLAISDDGNTVIKSGKDASDTYVYDLSSCQSGSFTVGSDNTAAMQGCRKRSLQSSLASQLPGFSYLSAMHFSTDGQSVSAIAARQGSSGANEFYTVTYSVAGYIAPHLNYLALGDSFSSGEGAYDYELGTNEPENTCHLSKNSYPYLAARAMGWAASFHSVACSGAETGDYAKPQSGNGLIQDSTRNALGLWQPGYVGQKRYLGRAGSTSVATVSMVGNDIGFGDILTGCLVGPDDCYHFKEDRESLAQSVQDKFGTLVVLYRNIKKDMNDPDAKVYVLGYPQIVGDGPSCDPNTPFSQEEREMARALTVYINAVIEAATKLAGVQYIDVTNAFEGHENCQPGTKAVNGLTYDNDTPKNSNLTFLHSSFHPNAFGQQLLAEQLLAQSSNFTVAMPAPDRSVQVPFKESPEYQAFIGDAPASGGAVGRAVYVGSGAVQALLKSTGYASPVSVPTALMPNASYAVYFHSTPTYAGTLTTDAAGHLQGQVAIPDEINPGFHTVHIVGQDVAGASVDLFQTVYVAASADDLNGNGVPDAQEQCVVVSPSGVDQDHDGIDDACDPEIGPASVDTMPPVVNGTPARAPELDGWYNHDVTINWQASDPDPSSGTPSQPASTLANLEGVNTYTSVSSCDPAGNCATGSLQLKLDKTPPTITYELHPAPNSNGWNNGPVTVYFSCADATSGLAFCTNPLHAGPGSVTGAAMDHAGNVATITVPVNFDTNPPNITQSITPASNAAGWSNSDVTVTSACVDDLSGVAFCDNPQNVTQEGANQVIVSHASDNAGNAAQASTIVNIDKTAPVVTGISWTNNPKTTLGAATMTIHASDNLSGVTAAEYFLGDADPGIGNGTPIPANGDAFTAIFGTDMPTGIYTVHVRVEDAAGNWSGVTSDDLVVYDPFGTRMTGRVTVVPALVRGDHLPGLASASQKDDATLAFSVGYDRRGRPLHSAMRFSYQTGIHCSNSRKAQNCHSLQLRATSVDWFTTNGTNNSTGILEGRGDLTIDGVKQVVSYKVIALDADRLGLRSKDHVQLQIFTLGTNPNTAIPTYQVNADVLHGDIAIKL